MVDKKIMLYITSAVVAAMGITVFVSSNDLNRYGLATEPEVGDYYLVLDNENVVDGDDNVTTSSGNKISFRCTAGEGVQSPSSIISYASGWGTMPYFSNIFNTKPINGLKSITFTKGDDSKYPLYIKYGFYSGVWEVAETALYSGETYYFNNEYPCYFNIRNSGNEYRDIASLTINYSCAESVLDPLSTSNLRDLSFTYVDSYYSVRSNSENIRGGSAIPATYNDGVHGTYPVTTISSYTGEYLIMSNNITTIGSSAFSGNTKLQFVQMSNNITSIGGSAFADTSKLESIVIPNGVTSLSNYTFNNSGIKELNTGNGLTSLSCFEYDHLDNLKKLTIGNSVSISSAYFLEYAPNIERYEVSSSNLTLSSVDGVLFSKDQTSLLRYPSGKSGAYVIPSGVITLANGSFDGSSVSSISFPSSLTTIQSNTFRNCDSLTIVNIPDTVVVIGDYAFNQCDNLVSATIGNGISTFSGTSFSDCPLLESITIGNGVTYFSAWFGYDTSLTTLTIDNDNYITDGGFIVDASNGDLICALPGLSGDVTLPSSVKTIRSSSIYCCPNITSITIPDTVTTIESSAISNCDSLTSITIGSGVGEFSLSSFASLSSLLELNISEDHLYYSSIDGIVYNKSGDTCLLVPRGLTDVTLSDDTLIVDSQAFGGNNITTVDLGDSCTTLNSQAFYFCYSLTSVTVPESLVNVSSSSFAYCSQSIYTTYNSVKYFGPSSNPYKICMGGSASSVIIHNDCEYIASYAFNGNSSITSLTVADVEIGEYAFASCSFLDSVAFVDESPKIGQSAFEGCYKITSLNIDAKIIEPYAFKNCTGVTSVSLSDGLNIINLNAFTFCPFTELTYYGTISSWGSILVASGMSSPSFVVHCTDGDIPASA